MVLHLSVLPEGHEEVPDHILAPLKMLQGELLILPPAQEGTHRAHTGHIKHTRKTQDPTERMSLRRRMGCPLAHINTPRCGHTPQGRATRDPPSRSAIQYCTVQHNKLTELKQRTELAQLHNPVQSCTVLYSKVPEVKQGTEILTWRAE